MAKLTPVILAPNHPESLRLLEMLQSEYVGMYGEPDPNPEGGVEKSILPDGAVIALFTLIEDPAQFGYQTIRAVAIAGWTTLYPGIACLRRMYVHYAWRGQGLSKTLLEEIEDSCRANGMSALWLETGTAQTVAIELYKRRGYAEVPGFGYYEGQETSVFLGRAL